MEIRAKELTEAIVKWTKEWFDENGKDCKAIIGMSGGKDSTICAAICVKALGKDRVIGVAIPETGQSYNEADEICGFLGIRLIKFPIGEIINNINLTWMQHISDVPRSNQTTQNIPPRLRMLILYAIAQSFNGRVIGTCNFSETILGYFTLWGDQCGDCEPLGDQYVSEVKAIGKELGIPDKWVDKIPDDGLPNSCPDEEKLGFTYEQLENFLEEYALDNPKEINDKILERIVSNKFKQNIVNIPKFNNNY